MNKIFHVKSDSLHLDRVGILSEPVEVLVGVDQQIKIVLGKLGIISVFDLGSGRAFLDAKTIFDFHHIKSSNYAKHGRLPNSLFKDIGKEEKGNYHRLGIEYLSSLSAEITNIVKSELHISSIAELANWPPFKYAFQLIQREDNSIYDDEYPTELVPKIGEFLTEKFYYKRVVLDPSIVRGNKGEPGLDAQNEDFVLDMMELISSKNRTFTKVSYGAILSIEQTWHNQGVGLGSLLHSLALAPGESTKIAVIDWSRKERNRMSQITNQNEYLDNKMLRKRVTNEVTNAVARELQTGSSDLTSESSSFQNSTSSASTTMPEGIVDSISGLIGQVGSAFNPTEMPPKIIDGISDIIDKGAGLFEKVGGLFDNDKKNDVSNDDATDDDSVRTTVESNVTSNAINNSNVYSIATSTGTRDVFADTLQNVQDSTHQQASLSRTRRASVVMEVDQNESESISTRTVTNYNHMHALTVQYYEMVQSFKTTLCVKKVDSCIFIPIKFVSEWNMSLVINFIDILKSSSLDLKFRNKISNIKEYRYISVPPNNNFSFETYNASEDQLTLNRVTSGFEKLQENGAISNSNVLSYLIKPVIKLTNPFLKKITITLDANSQEWVELQKNVEFNVIFSHNSNRVIRKFPNNKRLNIGIEESLANIDRFYFRIKAKLIRDQILNTKRIIGTLGLLLNDSHEVGIFFDWKLNKPSSKNNDYYYYEFGCFPLFSNESYIINHLNENAVYYNRTIWSSLGPRDVSLLLSKLNDRDGQPLLNYVDPTPVSITANYLGFKYKPNDEKEFLNKWKEDNKFDENMKIEDIVPLSSGGVFAEAILGRANSAEKLDITRFWNWQDSPIPVMAPNIADIQAGSRAIPVNLTTGNLENSPIRIQEPSNLPNPQGLSGVLNVLGNSTLFRDMSNVANNAALAQAAIDSATQAAISAQVQGGANMSTAAQFTIERLKVASDLIKSLGSIAATAITGIPTTSGQSTGYENISNAGATYNQGKKMDETRISSTPSSNLSQAGNSTNNSSSIPDTPSTQSLTHQPSNNSNESAAYQNLVGRNEEFGRSGTPIKNEVAESKISFDFIIDNVSPIRQPKSRSCWATTFTMMKNWKENQNLEILDRLIESLDAKYVKKFKDNSGLRSTEFEEFRDLAGLESFYFPLESNPFTKNISERLFNLLKNKGPLWVAVDEDVSDDFSGHVKLLIGMYGTLNDDQSTFYRFIDPALGLTVEESYNTFISKYSGISELEYWPQQILYFPE